MSAPDMSSLIGGFSFDTVVIAMLAIAAVLAAVYVAMNGVDGVVALLSGEIERERKLERRFEGEREYQQYKANRLRAREDAANRSRDLARWREG